MDTMKCIRDLRTRIRETLRVCSRKMDARLLGHDGYGRCDAMAGRFFNPVNPVFLSKRIELTGLVFFVCFVPFVVISSNCPCRGVARASLLSARCRHGLGLSGGDFEPVPRAGVERVAVNDGRIPVNPMEE